MAHEQLKPKDKIVTRMTRVGAVEENLTEDSSERVSQRLQDAELVKPHSGEVIPSVGVDTPDVSVKHHQAMAMQFQEQQKESAASLSGDYQTEPYLPADIPCLLYTSSQQKGIPSEQTPVSIRLS